MADTTEMRRLMTHAADLLDACEPMANADEIRSLSSSFIRKGEAIDRAVAEVAAMVTASTVLRMVAAAMADETERVAVDPEEKP